MIEKYIKELLYEHNCVIIPDFGGIIANNATAVVEQEEGVFRPPIKKIAFNESLQTNDGLLINAIAVGENISHQDALLQIKMSVKAICDRLQQGKSVSIEGVGLFSYDVENRLQFVADHSVNYLEESFGLTELHFKPIDREEDMKRVRPPQAKPAVRRAPVSRAAKPKAAKPKEEVKVTAEEEVVAKPVEAEVKKEELVLSPEDKQKRGTEQKTSKTKNEETKEEKPSNKKAIFLIIPILLIVLAGGAFAFMKFGNFSNDGGGEIALHETNNNHGSAGGTENHASIIPETTDDNQGGDEVIPDESNIDGPVENVVDETTSVVEEIETPDEVVEEPTRSTSISSNNSSSSMTDHHVVVEGTSGKVYVIAGSFSNQGKADVFANRFGTAFVLNHGGKYRVAIGEYSSTQEAKSDLTSLKGQYGHNLWILEY